jgi:hypothetical protein
VCVIGFNAAIRGPVDGVSILSLLLVKRLELIAITPGLRYLVEQVDGGLEAALQELRSLFGDH